MGDLYASAIGTTVLQLKDIPPRPKEFDGAIVLFSLAEEIDEAAVDAALREFGEIASCALALVSGCQAAMVRFTSHSAAERAVKAPLKHVCSGLATLYNERSYDGTDGGRGWCAPPYCGPSLSPRQLLPGY